MGNYKVIKIIDDIRVLINAGTKNSITKDSVFEIYLTGSEIKDPDAGEILGTLDTIKATVKPTVIYEKMCICTNAEYNPNNIVAAFSGLNSINSQPIKRLNVDTSEISGGLKDNDPIKIGDKVRLVKTYTDSNEEN
ncbi:hypothetical protein ACV3RX_01335 [Clostridium perfringens]|uniref:hypothetical protein n=1 Tax=Clostridium perfringens TaxID=1502 RepID=UPI000DA38FC8|nr:hypothetical protein [Clostridium perfringens]EHA1005932.1 hypothetical protein [Clostridium perfringens]EHA1008914.1 hypothetical protein [Clostridium perfringens]EHA1020903.1 hypothetical protein [Clostridium perfringens]SQI03735.1 Uncharacterised protein [Clostridium perfringens]